MKPDSKNKQPEKANAAKDYNPTDRDFQHTEDDLDSISQSEKDENNKATENANTKPTKEKIN